MKEDNYLNDEELAEQLEELERTRIDMEMDRAKDLAVEIEMEEMSINKFERKENGSK